MEELCGKVVSLEELGAFEKRCVQGGLEHVWLTCLRNRGELAEGWYDPATLRKARDAEEERSRDRYAVDRPRTKGSPGHRAGSDGHEAEEDDDDEFGPSLPSQNRGGGFGKRAGPKVPNLQDLQIQREMKQGKSNSPVLKAATI